MFDLKTSLKNAALRFSRTSERQRRSDAGKSRLDPSMQRELADLLRAHDRPSISAIVARLNSRARALRVRVPSRASIYNFMPRCPPHHYAIGGLPDAVCASLYNLGPSGRISGPHVVFYAFQHGELRAISFASGLPWIDLYLADRMRGWRTHSQGLLRAVLKYRGIE